LVIVNEELLGKADREIPTMLDYRTHIKKNSAFNTPPVFPIYVSMLVMEWVSKNGGVEMMQQRNEEKAALMYGEIDRNPLFTGVAATEDRSKMNATFVLTSDELADEFLAACSEADCVGLKGHRSVGGFRASMYNALPIESVRVLVEVMQEFERTHG
jgi:phosphoserine aminotransferase